MARILGLDLGSYAVKAVAFETTMRGYQTRTVASVRRAQEGDKTETLKAAIAELFAKNPMPADTVVVALPGPTLASHVVSLPFTEPKKIEQTLPFEIEGQLPFDLNEVVFDYQVASQKDKKTDLLVGVVRKDDLRSLVETLQSVKVEPRIITHPGLAYQNILAAMPAPAAGSPESQLGVAIVDIGHERTSVAIATPGGPVEFARTFTGGGRDLTRALMAEFQVPWGDSEKWKEEHGAVASAVVGPDAQRAAGAFVRGIQGVLRELRGSFKSYGARTRKQVSRVYLCGGTARLRGIEEQLSSDLGIPCELLKLPAETTAAIPAEEHATYAQPFALALRGTATGARAPRFNLRRGEFGFKGDFDFVKEKVGRLVAFAATLLLLVIASGVIRNIFLAQREAAVDEQMCEATKRVLNRCEKNAEVALSLLRGTESPAAAVPKTSAVQLLAELTSRMPRDANVTLDQIEVNLDRITIKATTDNTKQVDAVTTALKQFRCFKEVQQRKVERTRDGSKVSFGLDIQVECPAETDTPQG